MELIKRHLKEKYHLTNYETAKLVYLFKTLGSELSKMLLMGLLFYRQLPLYLFALILMLCLRSTTGGMHFYTYWGCLSASVGYLWLAVYALPQTALPRYAQLILLTGSMLLCYLIGPVTSKYRPDLPVQRSRKFRDITCMIIFLYALFLYIIPENSFSAVGFWVIILHSLQLCAAKIRKKGDCEK